MTMPLKVLGDRVLIKPDTVSNAPETTDSGVVLAKSMAAAITGEDATISVCRGTVIAVGTPRHPLHHEADALAKKVERFAHIGETALRQEVFLDAAHMLRDLVRKAPACGVGDDVLFSHDAGQQVTLENETYVLMREDELLAIVEPEPIHA